MMIIVNYYNNIDVSAGKQQLIDGYTTAPCNMYITYYFLVFFFIYIKIINLLVIPIVKLAMIAYHMYCNNNYNAFSIVGNVGP